jgi:hypothetical protein
MFVCLYFVELTLLIFCTSRWLLKLTMILVSSVLVFLSC